MSTKPTLQFCDYNLGRFGLDAYIRFSQESNIDLLPPSCQSRCYECQFAPYAVLSEEVLEAETTSGLIKLVEMKIGKK